MKKLFNLISNQDWYTIANQYQPKGIARELSFKEGMTLSYNMLFNDDRDDDLRNYATLLLKEIMQLYPKEWVEDWRNDVFLGDACDLTMEYEEQEKAYKRAYEKAKSPPPCLLVLFAGCYLSREPLISLDEAERMVKKALEKEISIEGIVLLRGIYATKKDQAQFDYWDKILQTTEKHMDSRDCWPSFLKF